MARTKSPTIPDDKINFFREQLFNEIEHLFEWEGLPPAIPVDYLERTLVRSGQVLFYKDDKIGFDVLACVTHGYNRHNKPTNARTYTPNTSDENFTIERKLSRQSDGENALEFFDEYTNGILLQNTYNGESCAHIVEHYAQRLALAQQAFDTQLLYANLPYIFVGNGDDYRLSIEKMFSAIFDGEPFIITDKSMLTDNKDRSGVPTNIQYLASDIMDTMNEIKMKFREHIGFDTAGIDKKERVLTGEIDANKQHTLSVLDIMKQQREIFCENVAYFFNQDVSVALTGTDELEEDLDYYEEGEEDDGGRDNRTEEPPQTD